MTIKPNILVLSGYGINSEEETLFPFQYLGAKGSIVHINDLVSGEFRMKDYQILAIPGGFSFGDDTGSGNAFANRLRNHLFEEVLKFVSEDKLVIGICNGAQILANLGLVPALTKKYGERQVALTHNSTARYECRWIDVKLSQNHCVWTKGIEYMHIPVSHGEGKFHASDEVMDELVSQNLITAQYVKISRNSDRSGEISLDKTPLDFVLADGEFPFNPNGSPYDIAALTDVSGRILQIMPHPERGMLFTQRDDWPLLKEQYKREGKTLPYESDGMQIFRNAVEYFE